MAAAFYVAPDGDDAHVGTTLALFATITRAQAAASPCDTTVTQKEARNTQSENIRLRDASHTVLERLVLRDGMGIGVYIHGRSRDNLVVNRDA